MKIIVTAFIIWRIIKENEIVDKLVTIILVNYNGYNDTVHCVKSILKSTYKNYKIILVDNNSADRDIIRKDSFLLENTDVIFLDENLGFSGGNNRGIDFAKEKYDPGYYLLLNNDTEIADNAIEELIKTYNRTEHCGLVTGKIFYYDTPDIIWAAGGKFDFNTGIADQPALGKKDGDEYSREKETSFCTGCVMLISKEVLETVGKLDEQFFLYAEDTDYCCRVMNKHYKLMYTGNAVIYHKVSASSGRNSEATQYYNIRNNFYIIKWYCRNKVYGYLKRWYRITKEIMHGKYEIKVVIRAWNDFRKGILGKVEI